MGSAKEEPVTRVSTETNAGRLGSKHPVRLRGGGGEEVGPSQDEDDGGGDLVRAFGESWGSLPARQWGRSTWGAGRLHLFLLRPPFLTQPNFLPLPSSLPLGGREGNPPQRGPGRGSFRAPPPVSFPPPARRGVSAGGGVGSLFRAAPQHLFTHTPLRVPLPGVHVLQLMYGCVVGPDGGAEAGYFQFGYDGEDFVSLDKETRTWTARVDEALATKRKWEADMTLAQYWKGYLEEVCVEWVQRYLRYGKETLQRTVPPTVNVTRKEEQDGQETLLCRAHGFYPKNIRVTWMKDGVDQEQDTLTWEVVPNSDGTYHKWRSIEVDPKDRDRYRCHVEHDSLEKPLDLAWEEPASSVSVGLIVGVLVGVLLAAAALVGGVIYYYIQKRNRPVGGYKATPGSEQGSNTSVQAPSAVA